MGSGIIVTFAPCEKQRSSPPTVRHCTPRSPLLPVPRQCRRAGHSCPPSRSPPAAAQPRHVRGAFQAVSDPCLRGPPALAGSTGSVRAAAGGGLQGPVRTLTPRAVLVLQVSLAALLLHPPLMNSLPSARLTPRPPRAPGPSAHRAAGRFPFLLHHRGHVPPVPTRSQGSASQLLLEQRATFPPPLTRGRGNAASGLYRAEPQAFWVPVEELRGTLLLSLASTCWVLGV